jgi:hypothetical protein
VELLQQLLLVQELLEEQPLELETQDQQAL